ncbi:MAG: flippase-like domain-containing protein [Prevotella sp.]|nr:flippase-like domain-containing protein [Prevotella sp.]
MKLSYIWIAVLLGMGVIAWMMISEFDLSAFGRIPVSPRFFAGISCAVGFFVVENVMRALRFYLLTDRQVPFVRCLRVDLLCEFTSAVTPSAVGGSGFTFLYLNREGASMGQSTFAMIAALMADELFLAVSSIMLMLLLPSTGLFGFPDLLKGSVRVIFTGSVIVVTLWAIVLSVLIFVRPQWIGGLVNLVCRIPILRRFQGKAERFSNDLILASRRAEGFGWMRWTAIAVVTCVAWMSRFAIVAAILSAFHTDRSLLIAWARQWVLWMVSVLSPTPGGSGLAEMMFRIYYADFLTDASMVLIATMVWRCIFYYTYIFLGMTLLPDVFRKK